MAWYPSCYYVILDQNVTRKWSARSAVNGFLVYQNNTVNASDPAFNRPKNWNSVFWEQEKSQEFFVWKPADKRRWGKFLSGGWWCRSPRGFCTFSSFFASYESSSCLCVTPWKPQWQPYSDAESLEVPGARIRWIRRSSSLRLSQSTVPTSSCSYWISNFQTCGPKQVRCDYKTRASG